MQLRHVAFLSVLALLTSQMILVECNQQREGKKDREGGGNNKQRGAKGQTKDVASSPGEKGGKSKGGKGSFQGKFVSKDKSECVWSVTEADTVILKVDCTKGETRVSCAFGGKPSSCAKYTENPKTYWKQITRALRKQKNLCQDPKAILKSKECKKGPQDAHLKLISSGQPAEEDTGRNPGALTPTTKVNMVGPTTECQEDPDIAERNKAQLEYCKDSWKSFCQFFFSMLQSKSC